MRGVSACAAAVVIAVGCGVLAQSREWPTYGHDPGGMRFSPLTQITPANVSRLEVAWVYHMKPAAASARFASSEVTPLVINGMMYLATPYNQVVAVDSSTGKEVWVFRLPSGNPSTRGVEYWPGDAQTPPQIVFGSSDGKLVLARREDREAQRGLRRQGHRQSEYAGDPAGAARPRRPELAAHRVQEPRHHGRNDAGKPAEGAGRRRARVGHAHGQAGVDVPFDSARG